MGRRAAASGNGAIEPGTSARVGLEDHSADQSRPGTRRGSGVYVSLLRAPGAARFWLTALVGRTPMAMLGLGTVLLVTAMTGRYAEAGLVAGAAAICYGATAPQLARLADRYGQHRVLRPLACAFCAACAFLIACAELRAPFSLLIIAGCLAGASMPSLGSMVRARWSNLLADPASLQTAFALESVTDELVFVICPAIVTLLATAFPPAGVLLCMVIGVAGTLLFAGQRSTEPPPHPRAPSAARVTATTLARLPARGLVAIVPVYLCLGAQFASIDLSTVDFAQSHGHKPLAGLLLGTYALGSGIGGLWYGTRSWRMSLERRFTITLALTTAGVATFWALPSLIALDVAMIFAGLTIAPTLVAGYGLVERQAHAARRTEAMAWLSSTVNIGIAAGSSVTGRIIDDLGPRWGFAFASGCGVLALVICLAGLASGILAARE
jgi:MFS family permease